jgi:hypothetical protein
MFIGLTLKEMTPIPRIQDLKMPGRSVCIPTAVQPSNPGVKSQQDRAMLDQKHGPFGANLAENIPKASRLPGENPNLARLR